MLDDLALFVSIVEGGSLNAAASRAGMPPSTLTRRLQRLEQLLGCRLLHRSARRMVPTSEGWQYYERCRPLLAALQQATETLDASINRVAGNVRVLAPVALASGVLQPAWTGFMTAYPDINLELQLDNRREDLIGSSADLAIRVGPQPDSLFNQRLLGRAPTVLVAAPVYLERHGWPQHPHDLAQHALLLAEPLMEWRLQCRSSGEWLQLPPPPNARLRVNEIRLAVDMACDGLGILYCPLSQVHHALADSRLLRALPDWRGDARDIYAVWPQQRHLPARVRVLLDYLVGFTADHPLFAGEEP